MTGINFVSWSEWFFTKKELEKLYRVVDGISAAPRKLFTRFCCLEQIFLSGRTRISRQKAKALLGERYSATKTQVTVLGSGAKVTYVRGEFYLVSNCQDRSDVTCYVH